MSSTQRRSNPWSDWVKSPAFSRRRQPNAAEARVWRRAAAAMRVGRRGGSGGGEGVDGGAPRGDMDKGHMPTAKPSA